MEAVSENSEGEAPAERELTEEEQIEEEYRAWVVNTTVLYDYQKSYGLEWPILTAQWLPGVKDHPSNKDYSLLSMVLGTHTTDDEPNYLLIADVTLPHPDAVIDHRTKDEDGNPIVDKTPNINYTHRIRHNGEVNRARYMPQNSTVIATKSPSNTVYVFNYENHPELPTSNDVIAEHECHGHSSEGYGVCWNPNKVGNLLSGSLDGSICLWDLQEAAHDVKPFLSFTDCHGNGVEDVDWHKYHEYVFGSVGNDSSLALYDTRKGASGGLTQRIQDAHKGDIHALSFNPGSEHLLATGGADNMVNLWDLRKMNEKLHSFEGHSKEVLQVSWSPYNEAILGSCSADRRVNIWDVTQIGSEQTAEESENGPPELYFVHGGHKAPISDFSWNKNKDFEGFMASVAEGNVLQVWQATDWEDDEEDDEDSPEREAIPDDDIEDQDGAHTVLNQRHDGAEEENVSDEHARKKSKPSSE